jgi:uncharacterized protein (TIGR00369 family)
MTDMAIAPGQPPVALDGMPHGRGFVAALGLTLLELGRTRVRARAVVTPAHHQATGIVHGGWHASVVETVGSLGAHMHVADDGKVVVGVSNTTEFFRPHVEGPLDVEALPVHQGRTQQVWEVRITRPDGALVARGQLRLQHIDR